MEVKNLKCPKCGKSLLRIYYGKLEIKCPRCGQIIKVEIEYKGNEQSPRR
jgi:phage FluMu protein Com